MPDLSDPVADGATDPTTAAPEPPAGDPELAALVEQVSTAEAAETDVVAVPVEPLAPVMTDFDPPAPKRRRRSLALRFGVSFAFGFLLVVGIGAGVLYAWDQQYSGRVLPGVHVGATDLGGLTREQAEAALTDAYGWIGTGQIALTGPDGDVTNVSYADVGRGPDTAALLDAAMAVGRPGQSLMNLIDGPRAAFRGVTLDAAVAYDRAKLGSVVQDLAAGIDETPTDASVSASGSGTFDLSSAKDGRVVDQASVVAALDQQLAALETPASIALTIPVSTLPPAITTDAAEAARGSADRMAADLVVKRGKEQWTIDREHLAPLITFVTAADGSVTPIFDQSGLDPIIKKLAKDINQKVRDAGLKMVNGRVIATGSSREGRTLDAAGMKAAIVEQLHTRDQGMTATPVAAVVDAVEPKLTTADAEAFAPKIKLKSSYSVFYWPIINNHFGGNIEAPATKINGTVVPAGAKFDFWKVVGDLRKLPGTGPGNAIEGGKITVTGAFGGGICTTSTTLFNAAFRAGMIPLARKNHNEYITRYPAGLDATVWIVGKAKQTMSFKNDTDYPILITRTVTQAGSKRWLTFKIWTVPNGRKATVTNTVIKHGPKAKATIVRDPSKPVGYTYLNNAPADGAKVWTTVTIYEHGKKYWSKRYYSNYPAVDGVTIVGTKKTASKTAT